MDRIFIAWLGITPEAGLISLIALAGSVLLLALSVTLLPWVIVRIPADYFDHPRPHLVTRLRTASHAKAALLILKNLLGVFFLVSGIAMLILPGQGLITMLAALMLIDYPRKQETERWLVERRGVLKALNWLRRRRHREEFHLPRAAKDGTVRPRTGT